MEFPNKKYQIIYADPPWGYKNKPSINGTSRGFAQYQYNLMTTKEIKNMPLELISDDNSVCFMWATFPMIKDAIEVMESWGFKYRTTAFVWVKKNKRAVNTNFWGCGYYTRSNVEIVLLGTKGKILERKSRKVHQIIESPIKGHSEKPAITRNKIVELFGDLPRIELFARQRVDGWDAWGNEI